MVHAVIVEARGPESLGDCVGQFSEADREYYRCRAAQEAEAARASSCCEARMAHEELAAAYRLLSSGRQGGANSQLASDLAMFQFNPKPAG